jgi:hypothetical protein
MNYRTLLILLLAAIPMQAPAQTAYRSNDNEGNVMFSDAPVPGAAQETQIQIDAPEPSAQSRQQSEQQLQETLEAAGMDETAPVSTGTSPAQRQEAARKRLESAEQGQQEAEVVGPGDRKGTASGGSRLTPEYIQRVQEAEQEVEQARQELQESGANP